MNPKEKIQHLVIKSDFKEALRTFADASAGDKAFATQIILLKKRLNDIDSLRTKGLVSHTEIGLLENNLSNDILALYDKWEQETPMVTDLERIIHALPIPKDAELGVLQMFNCDRSAPFQQFNRIFEDKKRTRQSFQPYFIIGCPDEMPDSLASRIAHQIIEDEGRKSKSDKAIDYNPDKMYLFNNSR